MVSKRPIPVHADFSGAHDLEPQMPYILHVGPPILYGKELMVRGSLNSIHIILPERAAHRPGLCIELSEKHKGAVTLHHC